MSYNLSWMNETDSLISLATNTNLTMNGVLFNIVFLVLFLIILTQFKGVELIESLIASSFIMTIIGGLLWMAGLLPFYLASIPLWILILSLIGKAFKG